MNTDNSSIPDLHQSPAQGRRDQRYNIQLPLTLSLGRKRVEATTGDISLRGLFVRTEQALTAKQYIRLDMTLPFDGQKKLSVFGAVAFVVAPTATPGQVVGAGIEFYGNAPEVLQRWESFVNSAASRFPESQNKTVILSGTTGDDVEPPVKRTRFEAEVKLKAYFGALDDLVLAYTCDVSRGGMFIVAPVVADIGAELSLFLVHPKTGEEFFLSCIVRRHAIDKGVRGMGVEFVNLDEEARHRLWDFINSGEEETVVGLNAE